MSNSLFFSHDSSARNDEKMLMLRAEHGMEGIGVFWCLVESLFESDDSMLRHDKVKGLAISLGVTPEKLRHIIDTCIEEELLKSDGEFFWSDSLIRRKSHYINKVKKASMAGKISAEKRAQRAKENGSKDSGESNDISTDVQHPFNERSTDVQQPLNECSTVRQQTKQNKTTETRQNKKKEVKKKEFPDGNSSPSPKTKKRTPTPKPSERFFDKLQADPDFVVRTHGLDESVVALFENEFVEFRRQQGKPLTDLSAKKIYLTLAKESVKEFQVEMLNASIMQGWTGVFPLKDWQKERVKGEALSQRFGNKGEYLEPAQTKRTTVIDRYKQGGEPHGETGHQENSGPDIGEHSGIDYNSAKIRQGLDEINEHRKTAGETLWTINDLKRENGDV